MIYFIGTESTSINHETVIAANEIEMYRRNDQNMDELNESRNYKLVIKEVARFPLVNENVNAPSERE